MNPAVAQALSEAGMGEVEMRNKARLFAMAAQKLKQSCDSEPLRWFVPGRIEVLGKHTDYAGGRSLLCTAERGFCVTAIPRSDAVLRITDVVRQVNCECEISPDFAIPVAGWTVYPAVVARRLARNFPGPLHGAEIAFASDLPSAAGMSSSSALVVTIFAVVSAVNQLSKRGEYDANIQSVLDLATYMGCIENGQTFRSLLGTGGVGTFGGSEDHTAILTSQSGRLKQYSFSPVRPERAVRVPRDCVFVIGVSGIVADKTGSAKDRYNQVSLRVDEILRCWRAFSGLRADTLAEAMQSSKDAPEQIRASIRQADATGADHKGLINRFDQFCLESENIIPSASDALSRGDLKTFGALVNESQQAAENLLGNQVPETIRLVRSAHKHGAYAASAFGAGFGGSVWALVAREAASQFLRCWQQEYESIHPAAAGAAQFFVSEPGPALCTL
jgi:galactokinase